MACPTPDARPASRRGQRLSLAERYYERGLAHLNRASSTWRWPIWTKRSCMSPSAASITSHAGSFCCATTRDEAEEDFAAGLSLDRRQWLAHYGRGMRAFQAGQYAEAIDHFSRAQHIAVNRPEIYMHRAVAFYMHDNPAEAIKDMEFALTLLDPSDARQRKQANDWLAVFRGAAR